MKYEKTRRNLMSAFAGESQAHNRYSIWAMIADAEGHKEISRVFTETANHEKHHARNFYEQLVKIAPDEMLEVAGSFPAHIGNTLTNLEYAANGEKEEHHELYPRFANEALEEGLPEVKAVFQNVITAEKYHEYRYRKLAKELGSSINVPELSGLVCPKCGFIHHEDNEEDCPICGAEFSRFKAVA